MGDRGQRALRLAKQQAGFPADAFSGNAQLFESAVLDLADAFLADAEQMADLAEAVGAGAVVVRAQREKLFPVGAERGWTRSNRVQ